MGKGSRKSRVNTKGIKDYVQTTALISSRIGFDGDSHDRLCDNTESGWRDHHANATRRGNQFGELHSV